MHQFKSTVLPVLWASSSSLATKCVPSEFTSACISKMCLLLGLLAVRKQRRKSAFPSAGREPAVSGLLRPFTWVPGRQGPVPALGGRCGYGYPTHWHFKPLTAGESPGSSEGAPGHFASGPREGGGTTGHSDPSTPLPCSQSTYSLAFPFKITIFFFSGVFRVYTYTKNTSKVQVTAINEI